MSKKAFTQCEGCFQFEDCYDEFGGPYLLTPKCHEYIKGIKKMEAWTVKNKEGEILLWTTRYSEADSIIALTTLKKQTWQELRQEGYCTVRVSIKEIVEF